MIQIADDSQIPGRIRSGCRGSRQRFLTNRRGIDRFLNERNVRCASRFIDRGAFRLWWKVGRCIGCYRRSRSYAALKRSQAAQPRLYDEHHGQNDYRGK